MKSLCTFVLLLPVTINCASDCAQQDADISDEESLGTVLLQAEMQLSQRHGATSNPLLDSIPIPHLIHIPKTGGTSIDAAGDEADTPVSFGIDKYDILFADADVSCTSLHVPPAWLMDMGPQAQHALSTYKSGPTFCSVRDPFSRAVSAFKHHLHRSAEPQLGGTMPQETAWLLSQSPQACVETLNTELPEMMADALQDSQNRSHIANLGALKCHWIPQHEFIWDANDSKWCQHIIHQEDLDTEFHELMREFGFPDIELPADNRQTHDELCPDLTVEDLTSETRSLLAQFYAEDFARLGYSPSLGDSQQA